MAKFISSVALTDTLSLGTYSDGLWLHDKTQGVNLAIGQKSERDAFVKALTYYQKRFAQVHADHCALQAKVDAFVGQVHECEDGLDE